MTKCPICQTDRPKYPITANDGGSILCPKCKSLYHECRDGVARTGYSPLSCVHCGYEKKDHVDYRLGIFEVSGQ